MAAPVQVQGARVSWEKLCEGALRQPVSGVRARVLSRLWAGYGSITELSVTTEDGKRHALIAKQVDPPASGGGESHSRKLKSYRVEAAFYSRLAPKVLADGAAPICRPLLVDVSPPSHFLLVLSDLRPEWPHERWSLDEQDARAALDWLAGFHALWWDAVPDQQDAVTAAAPFSLASGSTANEAGPLPPAGLWQCGGYWHLDTRQQELASMDVRTWKELKAAAPRIDAALKGVRPDGSRCSRHRTLCHGDMKAANLLFSDDGRCCCYDFQYCGDGFGVKDVVYLLSTSVDEDVAASAAGEAALLKHYHTALTRQLQRHGKAAAAAAYSLDVCTAHYELALCDWVRFMAGWGFWGSWQFASRRARDVLGRLDSVIAAALA